MEEVPLFLKYTGLAVDLVNLSVVATPSQGLEVETNSFAQHSLLAVGSEVRGHGKLLAEDLNVFTRQLPAAPK